MELVTNPVERQYDGQESATTHSGLQGPGWAEGLQSLPAYFNFSNQKGLHQLLNDCTPAEEYFMLC